MSAEERYQDRQANLVKALRCRITILAKALEPFADDWRRSETGRAEDEERAKKAMESYRRDRDIREHRYGKCTKKVKSRRGNATRRVSA